MASAHVPLPVLETVGLTYRAAWTIAAEHDMVLFAIMAASVGLSFLTLMGGLASLAGLAGQGLVTVSLALLAHHEILRGETAFDETVLGGMGERVLVYFAELAFLFVVFRVLAEVLASAVLGPLVAALTQDPAAYSTAVIALMAIVLFPPAVRLALRLPSRSIDQTLSWGQAWRLGRGNTPALAGGLFLVLLPVEAIVQPAIMWLFPDDRLAQALIHGVSLPILGLLAACFLSIGYLHCGAEHTDIISRPEAQTPAPRRGGGGLVWAVLAALVPAVASVVVANSKFVMFGYTALREGLPDPEEHADPLMRRDFFAERLPPIDTLSNAPFPDPDAAMTQNLEIAVMAIIAVWACIVAYGFVRYGLRATWMVVSVPFIAYSAIMVSRGL